MCYITGVLTSNPTILPSRHVMNLGMLLTNVGAIGWFMATNDYSLGMTMLGATTTTLSSVMGVTLMMAIGGESD